jgi:hypothetical protein
MSPRRHWRFVRLRIGRLVGILVIGAGCTLAAVRLADQGPVYSVAVVRAHLEHNPRAWVGRVVRVQGVVATLGCQIWPSPEGTVCLAWGQGLASPRGTAILPLTEEAPNRLLTLLRGVPVLGALVPASEALHWGAMATYRVQLRAVPTGSCVFLPCYEMRLQGEL